MHLHVPDFTDYVCNKTVSSVGPARFYEYELPASGEPFSIFFYICGAHSGFSDADLLAGRAIDYTTRPLKVEIVEVLEASTGRMCYGCYGLLKVKQDQPSADPTVRGTLPLSRHMNNKDHPFSLMFVVNDGFKESRTNFSHAKYQTGSRMLFHFRPKCLRFAFPNASVSFVVANTVPKLSDHQKMILKFFRGIQELYCSPSLHIMPIGCI